MSIALPGSSKIGLASLLRRNRRKEALEQRTAARDPLKPEEVASLFKGQKRDDVNLRPAKLNASEKQDQDRLSSLRGALYSDD